MESPRELRFSKPLALEERSTPIVAGAVVGAAAVVVLVAGREVAVAAVPEPSLPVGAGYREVVR